LDRLLPNRPAFGRAEKAKRKKKMNLMNPKEIKTHDTFKGLFPINEDLLRRIEEDMRNNKFDLSQPVILATWEGQDEFVCIDGHTRLQAAVRAGIDQIPVWIREDFETEEAAPEHAIKLQSHRRNMTDAELMACIEALDEIRPRGGYREGALASSMPQSCGKASGRSASAKETAEIVGCSPRKVEQARTVENHADPEILEALKKGEMSINKAYQETQKRRNGAQGKESNSDSGPDDSQMQPKVDEDKLDTEEEAEPRQQSAPATDTDEEIDPAELEPREDEKSEDSQPSTGYGEQANKEGFVKIRISLAHYEALSEYDGTVEEMVEQAIERYLEDLEREEDYDRAEYEEMWASDEEDEESDVEAA
jgi:hypothetical protein